MENSFCSDKSPKVSQFNKVHDDIIQIPQAQGFAHTSTTPPLSRAHAEHENIGNENFKPDQTLLKAIKAQQKLDESQKALQMNPLNIAKLSPHR